MTAEELVIKFSKNHTEEQTRLLEKALRFTAEVHSQQLRESGEPYIIHPIAVADIVLDLGMDAESVTAAVLHDTVEDGENITLDDISSRFGPEVAKLVDGVTKLTKSGKQTYVTKKQEQVENLRKLFLSMAEDVRVVIIKLADRLHNMRTLVYCNPYKRIRKAKETLEVYAPLAHRFGMGAIKGELEDLSFSYLLPDEYSEIRQISERQQTERETVLKLATEKITDMMKQAGIDAEINGRPKHLYSVYRKMQRQNSSINEIYDLIAIRIIVNTVSECYAALGILHAGWKPLPGRFKDYIATPKPNLYRSLHTTLLSERGIPFEVQIRTHEMHEMAEFGIAAHWMYKEGRNKQTDLDSTTELVRRILEAKENTEDSTEFVDNVINDFLGEYVFVLSPRGEIFDLPRDSTPLDFAYRIHTNIGHHCQGARVNGNLVRLDYQLKNNDVVEILTSNSQNGPSRDWLNIVKTQTAKNRIRQWFKRENREENIQKGKEMLEETARRQGQQWSQLLKPEHVETVLKRLNMAEMDDLYSTVGFGGISAAQVLHKFVELDRKVTKAEELAERMKQDNDAELPQTKPKTMPVNGIIVHGDPGMAVRFGNCCNPIPGDPILGYITRGRGVSVHKRDCTNAANLRRDPDRIIDVEWAIGADSAFKASLQILAEDRPGSLLEISALLSGLNVNILSISGRSTDAGMYICDNLTFMVKNTTELEQIMRGLRRLRSVREISRVNA